MKTIRKVHTTYIEFERVKKKYPKIPQAFGKWQYWLKEGDKTLSIICLKKDAILYKKDYWEIAEVEIGKKEDIEVLGRFNTLKEAKEFGKRWFKKNVSV